jgi:hypothetical protein
MSSLLEQMPQDARFPDKGRARAGVLWRGRAAVTVALVAYLLWRLHDRIGTLQLHLAQPPALGLAVGGAVVGVLLSVWLWRILIPRNNLIPFRHLLAHYLLGLLWNNFLPGGVGGDAVRAIALRRATGRADVAVSSVLMSRLAGLWSIALMAAVAALIHAARIGAGPALPLLLLAGGALIATAAGTAFLFGAPAVALMRRLPERWASWHARLRDYRLGPSRLLEALGWALAIQVCAVGINLLAAQALGLPITAWQLFLSLPLATLAALLPISLGGFGVREGSYVFLLGLLGVRAADALVLSLAVYALLAVVTVAGAGVCLLLAPSPGSRPRPSR